MVTGNRYFHNDSDRAKDFKIVLLKYIYELLYEFSLIKAYLLAAL